MLCPELKAFIQRIPKAELHCYLAGSIQPATLLNLAARHSIELLKTKKVLRSFSMMSRS